MANGGMDLSALGGLDVDALVRMQEEEEEARLAQTGYDDMFADWDPGERKAWEAFSPAGTTLTNFEMFSPGGYGPPMGPAGETLDQRLGRVAGMASPQDPAFMDWQGQVAPGALERSSGITNWNLANQGGWQQPDPGYPDPNMTLGQKQAFNQLTGPEQAQFRSFVGGLQGGPGPAEAPAPAAAGPDMDALNEFLIASGAVDAPATTTAAPPGGINLMGDLMGDPSLGYTMDPSGYRVDASGNIVDPEGNVTRMMPSGGGDYDVSQLGGFMDDYRFKDERPAMREQAYADALAGTGDFAETGPISLEDLQQFLGVVGTEDWFKHLQGQEDVNALYGDEIVDALARIDETGTATLPWIESREFAEKYGSPDGTPAVDGGGDPDGGGDLGGDDLGGDDLGGDDLGGGDLGGGLGEDVPPMFMPGGADEPTDLGTAPPGVPTFVQGQIDSLNIINNRFAEIEKVAKTLRDAGLADLEGIGEELKAAEQAIFEDQYGPGIEGPDGQLLDPGEMDRFWNTYKARQKTSKKDRETDRAKVVEIIEKEGVEPGLAKSQMDMITALHGDSVDAMFDYVDSMWRIGKLSHDERDSMITNMIASYQADLRSQVIDMLMAEGVTTAEDRAAINEEARTADAIAGLFPGMTEAQVYGLMTGGMENLLELPEEDPTGMINSGPWQGYTKGQQANAFLNKGYEYDAGTNTWTLDEDDPITGLIKSGAWAGYTEGEKSAKLASLGWAQDDTDQWKPPVDPTDAEADGEIQIPVGATWGEMGFASAAAATTAGYIVGADEQLFYKGTSQDLPAYKPPAAEGAGATVSIPTSELEFYGGHEVDYGRGGRADTITVTAEELQLLLSSGAFKPAEAVDAPVVRIPVAQFGLFGTEGLTVENGMAVVPVSLAMDMSTLGMIDLSADEIASESTIEISADEIKAGAGGFPVVGGKITVNSEQLRMLINADLFKPSTEGFVPIPKSRYVGDLAASGLTVEGDNILVDPQQALYMEDLGLLTPAAGEAAVLVPSGIMVVDFPELEDALEGGEVKNGEYWLSAEQIGIYGPLNEERRAGRGDFASLQDIIVNSPWPNGVGKGTGVGPWPTELLIDVQNKVANIQNDPGVWTPGGDVAGSTIDPETLWLRVISDWAMVNPDYAVVLANFTGRPVTMSGWLFEENEADGSSWHPEGTSRRTDDPGIIGMTVNPDGTVEPGSLTVWPPPTP